MPAFNCKRTPSTLAIMLAFGSSMSAHAQSDPTRLQADPESVPTVVVSASALSVMGDDMITPVSELSGNELVRMRESTLGETLNKQPGITSSHFGAGASRPIIRGMDGPRVKILSDGAEVQDASTISPDHAVGFEPMLAERVEVLRGPSALAYGGGAVGGVVNIIDRKIPTEMPTKPVEGSAELRANSVAREQAGAFELSAGHGNVAVHAEGVKRDASDYRVGGGWAGGGSVPGSFKQGETGTLGLSWIGKRGYLGAAFTSERTEYGIPGHDDEFGSCRPHDGHLDCGDGHQDDHDDGHDDGGHEGHGAGDVPVVKLDSERWDVRGEYGNPLAGFSKVRLRAAFTDYRHDELEDGAVSTSFLNKSHDARLELEHVPVGGWRGVAGVQTTRRDFTTSGEEVYVPPTVTTKHALFLTEEYKFSDWRLEAGARHERQDIEVDNPARRNTSARGTSLSVGAVWKFRPQYSLRASLARTHRLPTAEELYADGVHLATSTYEVGNQDLGRETSRNLDLTLRKFAGPITFSLSAFRNRVDNYIYANSLDEHEGFQLVHYAQRDATFTGFEGEVRHKLSPRLSATLFGDVVRARFDGGDGNRNIPRIPPRRIGVKFDGNWNSWHGMVELAHVGGQDDVAMFEGPTGAYNMINLGTHYSMRIAGRPAQLYARVNNLTDELAISHTSFIKNAAPLPGRNLTLGLRLVF